MNDTPTAAPMREDFLAQLRRVAADRMATWCSETELPCGLFHATELGGEVGEVLNVVKKLHREAQGWLGSRATVADLSEEIGDVVVCLDKLAAYYGIDLAKATAAKFNATSEKVGLPHRLPEGATSAPMFTFSADVDDIASETSKGEQSARSNAKDGYATAFYEIAKMLGIGARAKSPFEVWRDEMRPKLEALTARAHETGMVDRHALAKVLNEAAGPRRIAGEEEAALFADSKSEVQEYWLEMADAAIAAMPIAPVERFRHVKRGTLYEMVGTAELQAGQPQLEHAELAIYRGEDGKLWARNTAEFHDGRFVAVSLDQPAQPSRGFSRFDPPGLWESEPRSGRVVIKEAGER